MAVKLEVVLTKRELELENYKEMHLLLFLFQRNTFTLLDISSPRPLAHEDRQGKIKELATLKTISTK